MTNKHVPFDINTAITKVYNDGVMAGRFSEKAELSFGIDKTENQEVVSHYQQEFKNTCKEIVSNYEHVPAQAYKIIDSDGQLIAVAFNIFDADEITKACNNYSRVCGELEDYKGVVEDYRRLTRKLDVAMHGESAAARQASLCDLIGPAEKLCTSYKEVESLRAQNAALVKRINDLEKVIQELITLGRKYDTHPIMQDSWNKLETALAEFKEAI